MHSRTPLGSTQPPGLPGSLTHLSAGAVPNHPGESCRCSCSSLPCRCQASSSPAAWPLPFCVTRPNRVHLRYGSRLRLPRLRHPGCPEMALGRLHGGRAVTMVDSFHSTSWARLAWRTEEHEDDSRRGAEKETESAIGLRRRPGLRLDTETSPQLERRAYPASRIMRAVGAPLGGRRPCPRPLNEPAGHLPTSQSGFWRPGRPMRRSATGVQNAEDDDGICFDAKKHSEGETTKERTPRVAVQNRVHSRPFGDGGEYYLDFIQKPIPEPRLLPLIPGCSIGKILFRRNAEPDLIHYSALRIADSATAAGLPGSRSAS